MQLGCGVLNEDIGAWDTSGVTTMYNMFHEASAFNQDISGWAVGSVMSMVATFDAAPRRLTKTSAHGTPPASRA